MGIKKICKLCIDIGMLAIMTLLMNLGKIGIVLHMSLGAVLFILLVLHNILNLLWWVGIGKGTYMGKRLRLNIETNFVWICRESTNSRIYGGQI